MSDPKHLSIPLQNFTGDMFAKAAEGAYQAMCAQLNILLAEHPEDEARLSLLHDQALQAKDMIAHQGKLIEKVYALARAEQQVADKAKHAFARLEDAVINQDETNPLVADLMDGVLETAFTNFLLNPDSWHSHLAGRLAKTLGVDEAIAQQFIGLIVTGDELLPDHLEEAFADLLNQWRADGYLTESDVDYVDGTY